MKKEKKSKEIRFSISLKITIVVVITFFIAVSVGTYLEYLNDEKYLLTEFKSHTEKVAFGLSSVATSLIKSNKVFSLQTMVEHTALNQQCSTCHIKKNRISQFLADEKDMVGGNTEIFVISKNFTIVASSHRDFVGKKIESLIKEGKWKHRQAVRTIKKVMMLRGNIDSKLDNQDLSYEIVTTFGSNDNSHDVDGVIFVSKNLVKLKESLFNHFLRILISLILLSSFIGAFLFLVLRKILIEPLGKITQRARMFEKGEKPDQLCINTKDELGFLCKTFNEMTEALVQREDDLLKRNRMTNSLYEILAIVSKSLNLQEILNTSLKKVIEVIGLDGGAILLFNASTYSLILRVSHGLSDEFVNSVRSLKADDGLVGEAFITGKTIALEEIRNIPRSNLEAVKKEGFKAGAYVPLKSKEDKVLGVLAVAGRCDKKFKEDEIILLDSIGKLIGVAIENAGLYEKTKKKGKEIELINWFGKLISATLNVTEVVEIVAKKMDELISFEVGGIHLLDSSKKRLNFLYLIEDRTITLKKAIDISMDETAFEQSVIKKKSHLRRDLKEEALLIGESTIFERFGIRSMITTPLISKEEIIGFFSVGMRKPNAYTEDDVELLEVASLNIATSIQSARIFENILNAKSEWENTFDSMNDLISIHDREFNILRVNKTLANQLNIEPNKLIGKKCYEIFHCRKEPLKNCPHIKAISTGKHSEGEIDGEGLLNGSKFLISASAIFDHEGKIIGSTHIMRDVTEKKISERDLIESNNKLKETLQKLQSVQEQLLQSDKLAAVGQLVSGVAHEINNPLTSVIGFSQLLMMKAHDERVKGDAEKIFTEANRAAKIVGNLLTFARQKKLERDYIDINDVVGRTLDLKAYEMKVTNIEVITEFDSKLPKTMADFQQLQQVFLNIIINAEQTMVETNKRGKLVVMTELLNGDNSGNGNQKSGEDKKIIRISFKDDGTGIPEKNLKKIFDPFFTTKEVGKGTGLGLSLSYGIIKEHDGIIYAKNNHPDRGATFSIEIPVTEEVGRNDIKEKNHDLKPIESKKILVVDDEEIIRALLKDILESKGHKIDLAQNGNEAANKIKRKKYDLIISDMKMPELGGKELYNLLRAENPALARRILFITGDTVNPETSFFLEKTGNHFLKKPFETQDLIQSIQETLANNVL